jgi:uncharacterized membrane protein
MTTGGWLFLLFGWGVVIGLTVWCLYRIFTGKSTPDEGPGSDRWSDPGNAQ